MNNRFMKIQKTLWMALILTGLFAQPFSAVNKKTAVLLPLAMYAEPSKAYLRQGIQTMLISRLSDETIEIVAGPKLENLLTEEDKKGVTTQARAEELARALQVQYALFGTFTALGGGYSIDLSILDLTQDPVKLTNFSEPASEDQVIPRLSEIAYQCRSLIEGREVRPASQQASQPAQDNGEEGIFMASEEKAHTLTPSGGISLSLDLMSFGLADLDQDGRKEWLILTRDNLFIYNRQGDALTLKQSLKTSIGEAFLKLSAGDFNANGKPEVFVVSMYGKSARTTIFEWNDGIKKINQMNGHLRVLKDQDRETSLVIFQDSAMNHFVFGKIYLMKIDQNGKWIKGDELKLPKEVPFYTLGLIDINHDGNPEFTGLNNKSQPFICDRDGTIIWTGDETLGGTNNAIRIVQHATEKESLGRRFPFESPMVLIDVDRDGKKELIAIKNILSNELLKDYTVYPTSQLVAYKIEGSVLTRAWVSREIPYGMMEMAVDNKTLYLAVEKAKMINLGTPSSRIMWFE